MIQIKNLSCFYEKKQIIKDISVDFEAGKLYAVIGPNGSGKTTFLHSIAKINKAQGELFIDGENYNCIGRREFAKKLALLPQEHNIPDMSVCELVSAGRYPYLDISGKLGTEDLQAVENAMKATDTERFAEQNVKKLSGGERQRAYIAMLCAQDTPYVLLDEPTSHLDISCAFDVMRLMCLMRDNGKCVIAVLHDLSLALKYADEVILICNGEMVSAASPIETVCGGDLEHVFGVRCTVAEINGNTEFIFS